MIQSMTGFASKTLVIFPSTESPVNISIALKSLNSRFFETTCKLPFALNNFETDFIKLFKMRLQRGHIYFTIHSSSQHILSCTITPNLDAVQGYVDATQLIKSKFKIEGNLTLNDIVTLPNVFNTEEQEIDEESRNLIFQTVEQLIEEVIEARKKEGLSLKKDLEQRTIIAQHEIDAIEKAFVALMEQQKALVSEELEGLETVQEDIAESRRQVSVHYAR